MWDVFKDWIFNVIQFFYGLCGDWGLAINHHHHHLPRVGCAADA